jgi:FkbM family methyltransferase
MNSSSSAALTSWNSQSRRHDFIAFSRDLVDLRLWRALCQVQNGCYIDIGAGDPVSNSVSYGFYLKGWRGVVVEPAAAHAANAFRQERPDDQLEPVALGASTGSIPFYAFNGSGCSSVDLTVAAQQVLAGHHYDQTVVPLHTLDQILDRHVTRNQVHWLMISVAGMEADVLAGWIKSPVRPWIVVINSHHPVSGIDTHEAWEHNLIRMDYSYAGHDGMNCFYVHQSRLVLSEDLFSSSLSLVGVQLGGRPCHPLCSEVLEDRCQELNYWRRRAFDAEAVLRNNQPISFVCFSDAARRSAQRPIRYARLLLGSVIRTTQATVTSSLRTVSRTRLGRSIQHRFPVRPLAVRIGLLKPITPSLPILPPPTAPTSRYLRWLSR